MDIRYIKKEIYNDRKASLHWFYNHKIRYWFYKRLSNYYKNKHSKIFSREER